MALAISSNPHTKSPKKLWDTLASQERHNEGRDYLDSEFDAAGMERLKQVLQSSGKSGILVKG